MAEARLTAVAAHSREEWVVGRGEFALRRDNDELGIEGGVETAHQIAKTIEDAHHAYHGGGGHTDTHHGNGGDDVDGVVAFLGKEVAPGDEGVEQHGEMGSEFEKTVDVFGVVERVVDEKLQFRDDTQLVSHAFAQFETQGGGVGVDVAHDFFAALRGKYAQVGAADAHVGTNVGFAHADEHAVHGFRLKEEYFAQLLLEEAGDFLLAGCFHCWVL